MVLKTKKGTAKKPDAPLPKIGDYQLIQRWSTVDAGSSMWTFAERNGQTYHIKQHLSPVCPEEGCGIAAETIACKRDICTAFYQKMRRLYDAVNRSATGNIVTIENFFFFKTKFYTVTEKIENIDIPAESIARLPQEKKLLLLKVLAYSLMSLHKNGVVHADLKITNILFKKTGNNDNLLPKLIDFGDSFLVDAPNRYMVGDVYLAPESSRFIDGEDVKITQKADVFALGLLFHEFYTGNLPQFSKKYAYAFEALLDGEPLYLDPGIQPAGLSSIIRGMLIAQPEERPSTEVVFKALQELTDPGLASPDVWKCAVCGAVNDKNYTGGRFCVKCGAARETADAPDTWKCTKCGAANDKSYMGGNVCVKCGAPRDEAPEPDTWTCEKCGYENLKARRDCVKCGAARRSKKTDKPKGMNDLFGVPEL